MLADLGNTLINTNEIRKISLEYVRDRPDMPYEIVISMIGDKSQRLSHHANEAEAEENLERLRSILREANCVIDLRSLKT